MNSRPCFVLHAHSNEHLSSNTYIHESPSWNECVEFNLAESFPMLFEWLCLVRHNYARHLIKIAIRSVSVTQNGSRNSCVRTSPIKHERKILQFSRLWNGIVLLYSLHNFYMIFHCWRNKNQPENEWINRNYIYFLMLFWRFLTPFICEQWCLINNNKFILLHT